VWIHSPASIGTEGREREDVGGDSEEPGDRDDPDSGEVTEEGLSDLSARASRNELLGDDPGNSMERVRESKTSRLAECFDGGHLRTEKLQTRERVDFEGQLTHRVNSSLVWRNGP
jgi:hypothetical protein